MVGPSSQPWEWYQFFLITGILTAIVAAILGALWLTRRTPKLRAATIALTLLAVGLGIGYRIGSEPRWHINSLTNYAISVYQPTDSSEVKKFGIKSNFSCPGGPLQQVANTGPIDLVAAEVDATRPRGHSSTQLLATYEKAAKQLERDGWKVWRMYEPGDPTSNNSQQKLVHVRVYANKGDDFLDTQFFGPSATTLIYTSECLADKTFWPGTTSEFIVEEFTPDLITT